MTELPLQQRFVLITGAASGIGQATALALASQGAIPIILDKAEKKLNQTYDEIKSETGIEPVLVVDDLSTLVPERSDLLAEQIAAAFGRLDGLLHFAASPAPLTPIEHSRFDDWQKVINTNLLAPVTLTRSLLPLLKASDQAWVCFSSGEAGRLPKAYWGPTAICWGGLDTLAMSLNEEFAENASIRFLSIDPGPVNTPMRTRIYPGEDPGNPSDAASIAKVFVDILSGNLAVPDSSKLRISEGQIKSC